MSGVWQRNEFPWLPYCGFFWSDVAINSSVSILPFMPILLERAKKTRNSVENLACTDEASTDTLGKG